jgi:hypothetical protein
MTVLLNGSGKNPNFAMKKEKKTNGKRMIQ